MCVEVGGWRDAVQVGGDSFMGGISRVGEISRVGGISSLGGISRMGDISRVGEVPLARKVEGQTAMASLRGRKEWASPESTSGFAEVGPSSPLCTAE